MRTDREEEAEVLVGIVRDMLLHSTVEIELVINEIPADAFDRMPGHPRSDHSRVERFGKHVIAYHKEGG